MPCDKCGKRFRSFEDGNKLLTESISKYPLFYCDKCYEEYKKNPEFLPQWYEQRKLQEQMKGKEQKEKKPK